MKLSNYRYFSNTRIAFVLLLWFYSIFTSNEWTPVVLTTPTFAICLWRLSRIQNDLFTPQDMFWITSFLFFVISPNQIIKSWSFVAGPTAGLTYPAHNFYIAQAIVLIFLAIFAFFDAKASRLLTRNKASNIPPSFPTITRRRIIIIFFAVITSFVLYVIFSGGINNVLAPRRDKVADEISFISVIFMAIMATGAMLLTSKAPSLNSIEKILLFVCFILLFIAVNPFNSPRFFNLAIWTPIAMIAAGSSFTAFRAYTLVLFGLFVIMPITSIVSRGGIKEFNGITENQYYFSDLFRIKDIDVFDTLVHAAYFMQDHAYSAGQNILSIVLFFIPRSFWSTKPVGGGAIIGDDLFRNAWAGTDSLSFFIGGELYMDFGFIGVIIGSLIIGTLWIAVISSTKFIVNDHNIMACIATGSIPILIRGSLSAVVGIFFSLFCAALLYRILFRIRYGRSVIF